VTCVVVAGGVAAAALITPGSAASHTSPWAAASATPRARTANTIRPGSMPVLPGWTLIATLTTAVHRYASPGGRTDGRVLANWYERPSALPVIGQTPGWVRVRLATRPNESTAWVRDANLTFSETPYRIVVNLASKHLELLRTGHVVLDAPAGIGTSTDPTPPGQFFIAFREPSPAPGYGPFIVVMSAHSEAIANWEGSGDAVIGIHGPLGADIGSAGVAVSHGCIRLPVPDLVRLADLPAGTPITITA
jgi:L,D-transpeptidase catalytic domain